MLIARAKSRIGQTAEKGLRQDAKRPTIAAMSDFNLLRLMMESNAKRRPFLLQIRITGPDGTASEIARDAELSEMEGPVTELFPHHGGLLMHRLKKENLAPQARRR